MHLALVAFLVATIQPAPGSGNPATLVTELKQAAKTHRKELLPFIQGVNRICDSAVKDEDWPTLKAALVRQGARISAESEDDASPRAEVLLVPNAYTLPGGIRADLRLNVYLKREFSLDKPTRLVPNWDEALLRIPVGSDLNAALKQPWASREPLIRQFLLSGEFLKKSFHIHVLKHVELSYRRTFLLDVEGQDPNGTPCVSMVVELVNDLRTETRTQTLFANAWFPNGNPDATADKLLPSWEHGGSESRQFPSICLSLRRLPPQPVREQAYTDAWSPGDLRTLPTGVSRIRFRRGSLVDSDLALLSRFHSLKALETTWAGETGRIGIANLAALRPLDHLRLCVKTCDRETGSQLAGLRQVRDLDLYCGDATAEGIERLSALPGLHALSVMAPGDAELRTLSRLGSLRSLSLSRSLSTTPAGIAALAKLSHLESVDFSFLSGLTSSSLTMLQDLPIKTLWIAGCDVPDSALEGLMNWRCLVRVHLDRAVKLTPDGVRKLKKLPHLVSLGVDSCPGISDEQNRKLAHFFAPEFRVDGDP